MMKITQVSKFQIILPLGNSFQPKTAAYVATEEAHIFFLDLVSRTAQPTQ